ncbi:MAG: PASTA domain-containing protein [Gemmatimonadales bacterium]|nr:PASTA domain-containing protein [Gemmatimonadales bacterium]
MRRRFSWARFRPKTVSGRDRLRAGLLLGGAAVAGYMVTCVAYPAPLIARDHAVARVLGLPVEEAEQELQAQGFKVRREGEEADPVIPAGRVVWQDPPPETSLQPGAVVQVTVSSGPAPVTVPDVVAFEAAQARQVIEAAGLKIGDVDTIASAVEAGVIVSTRPGTGATRPPGSPIDLIVSRGPADIRIPDVIGLKQEDARQRIEAAGLRVGTVGTRPARRNPPGIVLEQRPAGGVLASHNGRINLVISQ